MQVRAIFEAAVSLRNQGFTVLPEIMVPLVGTPEASLDVLLVVCFSTCFNYLNGNGKKKFSNPLFALLPLRNMEKENRK